jgi:hypothetical protein
MQVELTEQEFQVCEQVVAARMAYSAMRGLNHAKVQYRSPEQRIRDELIGAASEVATAKACGLGGFVPGFVYVKGQPDIHPDIEVRATDHAAGHLIFRPVDDPNRRYVLALTSELDTKRIVTLAGWGWGHEFDGPKYKRSPYKVVDSWVAQDELRPMETFAGITHGAV